MVKDAAIDIELQRLVLVTPPFSDAQEIRSKVESALSGGDVASVIIAQHAMSDEQFIVLAEDIVPLVQAKNSAALIYGDSRALGRSKADGVHITEDRRHLEAAIERHKGAVIVGSGGAKTRHEALERGEVQPDYMCFGLIGKDTHPESHDKNLKLAEWWSQMVDIPCIVAGGNMLTTLPQTAATGAEFVMLSRAVFEADDPQDAVFKANQTLGEIHQQRLELLKEE